MENCCIRTIEYQLKMPHLRQHTPHQFSSLVIKHYTSISHNLNKQLVVLMLWLLSVWGEGTFSIRLRSSNFWKQNNSITRLYKHLTCHLHSLFYISYILLFILITTYHVILNHIEPGARSKGIFFWVNLMRVMGQHHSEKKVGNVFIECFSEPFSQLSKLQIHLGFPLQTEKLTCLLLCMQVYLCYYCAPTCLKTKKEFECNIIPRKANGEYSFHVQVTISSNSHLSEIMLFLQHP